MYFVSASILFNEVYLRYTSFNIGAWRVGTQLKHLSHHQASNYDFSSMFSILLALCLTKLSLVNDNKICEFVTKYMVKYNPHPTKIKK